MSLPSIKNENENNESTVIPYKQPLKSKLISISALMLFLYLGINAAYSIYANEISIDIGIIFTTVALATIIAFLLFKYIFSRQTIQMSEDKIEFSSSFAPDLLFRPKRTWDDIANIMIGSMVANSDKTTYEYELESSKNQKKVFIYFKSGGHATIDLKRINKESSEILFQRIESWCLDFSRTPQEKNEEQNIEDKPQAIPKQDLTSLPAQSFTELWQSELEDHFSSTNFVPLKKGDLVQDKKYKVIMPLSAGGLSAVYLVESKDKKLFVLKEAVIPSNLKLESKVRELFSREVMLLQKIDHPDIAKVIDHFVDNNRDYMLLEYIQGNTLKSEVAQFGPIEEKDALNYALAISHLVDYLHKMDPPIIHRDISPSNLILKKDGKVCLIDFGAANQLLSTATGTLVGKQSYMAPEQFRGKSDKVSDIYSIGATLFFLLTGKDPTPLEESKPRDLLKEISPLTDSLVSSCTTQSIDSRISSTDQLVSQISQILEHGGGAVIDTSTSN